MALQTTLEEKKEKISHILEVEIPAIKKEMDHASSLGDLKEVPEYQVAREKLEQFNLLVDKLSKEVGCEELLGWHILLDPLKHYLGIILNSEKDPIWDDVKKESCIKIITTETKPLLLTELVRIDSFTYKATFFNIGNCFILKESPNFLKKINGDMFFEIEQTDIKKMDLYQRTKEKLNNCNMKIEDLFGKYYDYGGNIYYEKDDQMISLNLYLGALELVVWEDIKI